MLKKPKIAILITDTYGEPFESLRRDFSPILVAEALRYGIDCYFIKGKIPTKLDAKLEKLSNNIRYSRFWPAQRVFDAVTLYKFNIFSPEYSIFENNISVNIGEGLRKLGIKVLIGAEILKENYDVVIKTTSSSAFNFDVLLEGIKELPLSSGVPIYAGSVIDFNQNKSFVSGANLVLNRSAIDLLLQNKMQWNHGDLDDVAIGKIMRSFGVQIQRMTTLNIDSLEQLEKIPSEILNNTQHFRCKSSENPRNDLSILSKLASRLEYVGN